MIEVFLITRDTTTIIESDGSARSKPELEVSRITSALMAVHKAHLRCKKMVVSFMCCNNYVQSYQGFNLTLTPFWAR